MEKEVFQEAFPEFLDLAAVHSFYINLLDKTLGHPVPVPQETIEATSPKERVEHSISVLRRWLGLLDMAITPPMVRDALKENATYETAKALLRYYITKASHRDTDRDKADFVVTYLFRNRAEALPKNGAGFIPLTDQFGQALPGFRTLDFEAEIYSILGELPPPELAEEHNQLAREFEFIRPEIEEFKHFDQLMDSGIMQRVRDIKAAFGKSFYTPRILAVVAEYNVFFGAKFDALFRDAALTVKSFAQKVQDDGASIMSKVQGDVMVKHLTEVEEDEILNKEYGQAKDHLRKVSQFKKAVDSKGYKRPANVAAAAAAAAAPAPAAEAAPAPAAPSFSSNQQLALLEEGKIRNTHAAIQNFVRSAIPQQAGIVPLRDGKVSLSPVEIDAFKVDYGEEKSFRADYARWLMQIVVLRQRMSAETAEYKAKQNTGYLWKPHADALAYLMIKSREASTEAGKLINLAQQRGLADKVQAMSAANSGLQAQVQTVAAILGS